MFEAVEGCSPSTPSSRHGWPSPRSTPTSGSRAQLNQRYAELTAIVTAYREWQRARGRRRGRPRARGRGPVVRRGGRAARRQRADAEDRLRLLLVPRDPADAKDAILEVKSGEGGEESALFAGDLLRMYTRYAERRGWRTEILDATESDLGGYKSVTVAVKAKGTPEPGRGAVRAAEVRGRRAPRPAGAGHRVAGPRAHLRRGRAGDARGRAGRRHDRRERPAHRRVPLLGPRRPERQHDRLRGADHPPAHRASWSAARTRRASCRTRSRRCASCAPGCSPRPRRRPTPRPAEARRSQVRTVDRSERIRTYNFPENRISDHRTGYKAYNLDQVLDGDLGPVLASCVEADVNARLEALETDGRA